ncbi:phage tail tape measure protein [Agrococcus jejuensis]|uniref:Phage-related minor tail protein n=1 Tax=Agrococcus jejuensis TaxID=399736 RepID=A0A1G8F0F7_9MICO|nr:phage tail tape measure protein [Agrococcus jejuensis]SDH75577.1 Phage-related minor tail protein [Agrococcus jejuensis]
MRVFELESLFTADTTQIAKAEKDIQATGKRIESKPITATVDGDAKGALASMDRVEQAAKRIVSKETVAKLDANVEKAEQGIDRVEKHLEYLRSVDGALQVTADIKKAEADLQRMQRQVDALKGARAQVEVAADTAQAEADLDSVADAAGDAGAESGDEFGQNLLSALSSLPIAGAVVGVAYLAGRAAWEAFNDGLQVEVSRDRLAALTGLSDVDAARIARAAGEAYANVFGDSIESNMDTARLGVQFDLIDADDTTREAQQVIQGLAGIADALGEDVQPVARATAVLLRTGLARSAQEAFDIIAAGEREGLNLGEDLLDTLTEYGSTFAQLGLTGPQAIGLLNQALAAGAPNTDFFADALRELGIRIRELTPDTADLIREVGLVPSEMRAAFTEGGPAAAAALDQLVDALREVEDPAERDRLAVGLLGTQFEDLQFDLDRLDLTTAVDGMNGVEGAAQRMFDTLSSNDATAMERAQRNVEVAVQGMQGALAVAFSDPLQEAADWVSENRGPMLQFFSDLVNGALDFGESLVISAANGTIAFGEFVSGPLRELVQTLVDIFAMPQFAMFGFETDELQALADGMGDFDETTAAAAQTMTDTLLPAIDLARGEFNDFADPEIALGHLNDTTIRLASSIDAVGYAADGATPLVDAYTIAQDGSVQAGAELEAQVRAGVDALGAQLDAAQAAGESQESLASMYDTGTSALADQLTQMGLNDDQARALIDTILATPESAVTTFESNAAAEQAGVDALADTIVTLPDGSVVVTANTQPAEDEVANAIARIQARAVMLTALATVRSSVGSGADAAAGSGVSWQAQGSVLEFYRSGGFHGLTPMAAQATMVPANTWRVVGDRSDVAEAYIPLDGSARSLSILLEAMRRFGVQPMADGGVVVPTAPSSVGSGDARVSVPITVYPSPGMSEIDLAEATGRAVARKLKQRG